MKGNIYIYTDDLDVSLAWSDWTHIGITKIIDQDVISFESFLLGLTLTLF